MLMLVQGSSHECGGFRCGMVGELFQLGRSTTASSKELLLGPARIRQSDAASAQPIG